MNAQSLRTDDCAEQVIRYYSPMVYRLAFSQTRSKADADDVFQEVFLRYLKSAPHFASEEHRKAWLLRVTINCSKTLWAAARLRAWQPLPDGAAAAPAEQADLRFALLQLPAKYRAVIHLFYYEDLSIEQIAAILHRKPSTVRTQLTRARYRLKELLKEEYDVSSAISQPERADCPGR